MKLINFNNQVLLLEKTGAIIWPEKSTAIISDLHLEKSSFFAREGNFIPPYDSFETLRKLKNMITKNKVKNIIFLGDIFHDSRAYERLAKRSKKIFESIITTCKVIFVYGNHDKFVKIPKIKFCNTFSDKNIYFSHEPQTNNNSQICGHLHPKIILKINGKRISKKCFVYSKNIIFLPAYGKYTGGLDVRGKVFSKYLDSNSIFFPIHNDKIYKLKNYI